MFVWLSLVVGGSVFYVVRNPESAQDAWRKLKEEWAERRAERRAREVARRREEEVGVEVGLPVAAVLEQAIEFMTRAGYGIESRTENTVTFDRHEGADSCLGCLLMLLFILPGLLYLLLAQRTVRVTFAAYPIEGGSRVVIGGDHNPARMEAVGWARRLPDPGEEVEEIPIDEAATTSPSSPAVRLRELAELRDQGLITEEEYEAKKTDLLDRM